MSLFDQLIEELKKNPQKLEEFLALFKDKITSLALEEINRKIDILLKDREEIFKRFEEHDRKFEEIIKRFEAHDKKFEEHDKKFVQIMEEIKAIKIEIREMNKRLTSLEKRVNTMDINLGFLTESYAIDFFTRYLNEKIVSIKRHYKVDDKEIDALVETENRYYLVEIKSRVSPQDVVQMYSLVGKFLKEAKKEVRPIILGVRVKDEAIEVGKKLGIEVNRL
ncbi:hypothetical protein CM19_00765 [Candidatus Acidianus copahuensis]|uniref:DUF3782 domain-containing protein n=1 Tax=Candidatus Acidianus copahuensis TaxID=1160895 RepID=A0A031LWM0_9CREN|nr:hypothetical protein [Candidatus Acidianus copahuensis]EZQ11538.1 hypothetical protein CM19_00765 [Candidatus Acidianus copahuensis]